MRDIMKWKIWLFALLLSGCTYESGFTDLECESDADCGDGAVCTSGFCVADGNANNVNNTNNGNNSNNVNNTNIVTVQVMPTTADLIIGQTQQLTATALDAQSQPVATTFAWTSSDDNIADVDNAGLVTGTGIGSATITATAGGISATATITVATNVASVSVMPNPATFGVGVEQQFTATALDAMSNDTGRPITWSVVDDTILSIDSSGLARGLAEGSTEVVATSDGIEGRATVTITPVNITGLVLDPDMNQRVPVGGQLSIRAVLTEEGGAEVRGEAVNWAYTPTIGSLSIVPGTPDEVNYVAPNFEGTTTISAEFNGLMDSIDIEVFEPQIDSVTIDQVDPTLYMGERVQFTATVMDELGNTVANPTISWFVDDTNIATIDANGELRARSTGTVVVTADVLGVMGTSTATVELNLITIEGGDEHSCGLAPNGAAICWGDNGNGRLGDASATDRAVPVLVETNLLFAEIHAANNHTCGRSGNDVYCWGDNNNGRLGFTTNNDQNTPAQVNSSENFVQVSTSHDHGCAVSDQNQVFCWGRGDDGRLGNNVDSNDRDAPTQIAQPADNANALWVAVSAGETHTCALTTTDEVYCWGAGAAGQLGDGNSTNSSIPVKVDLASVSNPVFIGLTSGDGYTIGYTATGSAYCWGQNANGQCGTDSMDATHDTPVIVAGGLAFSAIAAGEAHACGFLQNTGSIYCWGTGSESRLGLGADTADKRTPTQVMNFAADFVGAGGTHSCATDGGTAYCWGRNAEEQIGDNSTTERNTPTLVFP